MALMHARRLERPQNKSVDKEEECLGSGVEEVH
jgi:hypothetical protein